MIPHCSVLRHSMSCYELQKCNFMFSCYRVYSILLRFGSNNPNKYVSRNGILFKIVLTYCEKIVVVSDKKLLKFDAEGREFAKVLRSLKQFVRTVKGQNNVW